MTRQVITDGSSLHYGVLEPLAIFPEVFPQIAKALESFEDRLDIQISRPQFPCKFLWAHWSRNWRAAKGAQRVCGGKRFSPRVLYSVDKHSSFSASADFPFKSNQ